MGLRHKPARALFYYPGTSANITIWTKAVTVMKIKENNFDSV